MTQGSRNFPQFKHSAPQTVEVGLAGGRGRWRSRRLGLGVRRGRVLRGRCWCVGCSPWACFCARTAAAAGGSWARACVGCSRGSAVPREDRRGLDDDQAGPPTSPQPREAHPEDAVPSMELWPSDGSVKDGQLMAQGRVLEGNRRPVNEGASKGPETDREEHRHSLAGDYRPS